MPSLPSAIPTNPNVGRSVGVKSNERRGDCIGYLSVQQNYYNLRYLTILRGKRRALPDQNQSTGQRVIELKLEIKQCIGKPYTDSQIIVNMS